jgi:hypothetical protein
VVNGVRAGRDPSSAGTRRRQPARDYALYGDLGVDREMREATDPATGHLVVDVPDFRAGTGFTARTQTHQMSSRAQNGMSFSSRPSPPC